MKVVTFVACDRPGYTKQVLDALSACHGIGNYILFAHIEPVCEAVVELVRGVDFCEKKVTVNEEQVGISYNTWTALNHGFKADDFVIHVEDDTVPAPDLLAYMEWCRTRYQKDESVFTVSSYNRTRYDEKVSYAVRRRSKFTCWLYGIWKNRWEKGWKRNWSRQTNSYAIHAQKYVQKNGLYEVYPIFGRSQNVGAKGGVHVRSEEWHHQNHYVEDWAGKRDLKPGKYFEMEEEWK